MFAQKRTRKPNQAHTRNRAHTQVRPYRKWVPRSEGETRSYSKIAASIGRPSAVRDVARANGANQLATGIPCHRVIHAKGIWPGMAAAWRAKGGSWIMRRKAHKMAAQTGPQDARLGHARQQKVGKNDLRVQARRDKLV